MPYICQGHPDSSRWHFPTRAVSLLPSSSAIVEQKILTSIDAETERPEIDHQHPKNIHSLGTDCERRARPIRFVPESRLAITSAFLKGLLDPRSAEKQLLKFRNQK